MKKNWFTVKELFSNIWGIGEFSHSEKVISYLLVGEERALLFDTGMGIGDILEEVKRITKLPVMVIDSHCHPDHMGGNWQFTSILGIRSEFSKNSSKHGYSKTEIQKYYQANNSIKSFQIAKYVKDGDLINMAPFSFEIIQTPGHTPDSICLYEKNFKILLTGDSVYRGPIYLFLKESNFYDYKKSIKKLSKLDIKTILPGHNDFIINANLVQKIHNTIKENKKFNVIQVTSKTFLKVAV